MERSPCNIQTQIFNQTKQAASANKQNHSFHFMRIRWFWLEESPTECLSNLPIKYLLKQQRRALTSKQAFLSAVVAQKVSHLSDVWHIQPSFDMCQAVTILCPFYSDSSPFRVQMQKERKKKKHKLKPVKNMLWSLKGQSNNTCPRICKLGRWHRWMPQCKCARVRRVAINWW